MLLAFPLLGLLLHSAYSATTPEILAGLTVDNPALADLTVTCAHTMGGGLEARSCFNAWHYAPNDPLQEVFLPNDTPYPSPPGTVIAPKVVFSNDTTCAIVADTRAPSARASSFNVSEAARAIIMRCVIPRRLGGYAQHIGGDNKLLTIVRSNLNRPRCRNPVVRATERSCGYILDEMLKHAHPESFGTAAHFPIPITVALPLTLRSPDGGCMIVIDQFPRQVAPVETTWSRVWYAAEAVTAGCIRSGTAGEIQVLNRLDKLEGGLMVGILDEPSGPAQSPVAVA